MRQIVAVLVAVVAAAAAAAAERPAFTVTLFGAPLSDALPSEKIAMKRLFDRRTVVAFKNAQLNEISAFAVSENLESIFDPANVELKALRDYLNADVPLVAVTLGAARYLALPELALPVRSINRPVHNLETTFQLEQDKDSYPVMLLFLAKDGVKPGNERTLEHLLRLGELSFHKDLDLVQIISAVADEKVADEEAADEGVTKDVPVLGRVVLPANIFSNADRIREILKVKNGTLTIKG